MSHWSGFPPPKAVPPSPVSRMTSAGPLLLECCNFTEPVKMQNPKLHLRLSRWRARNVHFSSNPGAANLQIIPDETPSSAKGKNDNAFSYSLPKPFLFLSFSPSVSPFFLPSSSSIFPILAKMFTVIPGWNGDIYIYVWRYIYISPYPLDFSVGSVMKNPPVNAGDSGSIPGLGRSPGEGNGNPHQYSYLENPTNRGL